MAIFVSAKTLTVIQFGASDPYRLEPSAILDQYGHGTLASLLVICEALGFEARDKI